MVLIDGRRVGVVSFDGQTRAPRFGRSLTWDGLSRGNPTVRLVMRNGAGCVDAFVVAGAARGRSVTDVAGAARRP